MRKYLYEALNNKFIVSEQKEDNISMIKCMKKYNADGYIIYKNHPLEMQIFNKDGSVATMCGNGLRCFLLYGLNNNYLTKKEYLVKVQKNKIPCEIISKDPFYSKVVLSPSKSKPTQTKVVFFKGKLIKIYTLFIGTLSHVIFYEKDINIEELITFLKKVFIRNLGNISFVNIKNKAEMYVFTYERGVGFTPSCGTGNAASFFVSHSLGLVDDNVIINNRGGRMKVSYSLNSVNIYGTSSLIKEIQYE